MKATDSKPVGSARSNALAAVTERFSGARTFINLRSTQHVRMLPYFFLWKSIYSRSIYSRSQMYRAWLNEAMLKASAMQIVTCMWEEIRYATGTSAWVVSIQNGSKRGAKLASRACNNEVLGLKQNPEEGAKRDQNKVTTIPEPRQVNP